MSDQSRPIALTIAGSDSGGGAGIQADLKTFAAWEVFGTSAIVAITAQNTLGVRAIHPVPVPVIIGQLDAVAEDLPPVAFKSGMLATREVVVAVAERITRHGWKNYILDPVMVSTSGHQLLDRGAVESVRDRLVPLSACVTPNLDEAELLTGLEVRDPDSMEAAGYALLGLGANAALIKGGHLRSDILVDILVTPGGVTRYTRTRMATRATHGTGCTLSAAITAGLTQEMPLEDAVPAALEYLQAAMRAAPGLGRGAGPVWHGVVPE